MSEIRPNKAGVFPFLLECTNFSYRNVALANSTQYKIMVVDLGHGEVFVAIEGRGAYSFSGYAHKGYVQDKLNLKFEGDAANIADFINDQLKNDSPRQGEYDAHLCRD